MSSETIKTATEMRVWYGEPNAICSLCCIERTAENEKQECPVGRYRLARRCEQAYEKLIGPLRAVAQSLGYALANGPGKRGVHHSVIYRRGELAHDPHPSKDGLLSVEWTWHLEAIANERKEPA